MNVDAGLIIRCKDREKSAFRELFQLYERYLYTVCYSYTQNEQDALDIVQEVYIKIFRHIASFEESMSFHPWVRRIAVNSCLNFRRDAKVRILPLYFETASDETQVEQYASDSNVEMEIERRERKAILRDGLQNLPDHYRMIIVLRYFEDLSYQEIADLLNKPLGTIKTELYRAKLLLKKKLQGDLGE